MRILGIHTKHSGGLALLDEGQVKFAVEAEKDSNRRYACLTMKRLREVFEALEDPPDVLAFGGWRNRPGGYLGTERSCIEVSETENLGFRVREFATSHERTHIFGSYGLSGFEQGEPCYVLICEGTIGSFYEVDRHLQIRPLAQPLANPGHRYAFLYELADPEADEQSCGYTMNVAGNLMALCSFSSRGAATTEEAALIDALLDGFAPEEMCKADFRCSPYFNMGVEHTRLKEVAGKLSDAMFDRFYRTARSVVKDRRPLLIGGGCGLNCDWNTKWRNSGLFSEVFIPPCTDDSGSALGAAIDAQHFFTGEAKVDWSVYDGLEFVHDSPLPEAVEEVAFDAEELAAQLQSGAVFAWVEGRCEIGPRALGHRSILASPFQQSMTRRLNNIKFRQQFRPIAPICAASDVGRHFDWEGPSPYMLYFQSVTDKSLKAVTHVDGTARLQSLEKQDAPLLFEVLQAFKRRTGAAVLCNTSLNFPGRGFINRTSDIVAFVEQRGLEGMVIDGKAYLIRRGCRGD